MHVDAEMADKGQKQRKTTASEGGVAPSKSRKYASSRVTRTTLEPGCDHKLPTFGDHTSENIKVIGTTYITHLFAGNLMTMKVARLASISKWKKAKMIILVIV